MVRAFLRGQMGAGSDDPATKLMVRPGDPGGKPVGPRSPTPLRGTLWRSAERGRYLRREKGSLVFSGLPRSEAVPLPDGLPN